MDKKQYLKKAITIIENNLSDKVAVGQIALDCCVSPRQFYRDFYSLTGHSVHEYIRRRRLSKALSLLKNSEMDAAAVAYTCGYSSQAALCQTVKTYLGTTPKAYKNRSDHYFFPIFNTERFMQIEVKSEALPQMISIQYGHRQLRGIENRAVAYFLSLIPEYKGRLFGRNEKQVGRQFCYELQVEYSEALLEQIRKSEFIFSSLKPPGTSMYAKTIVKNDEAEINDAWEYLYSQWMKNSMFEQGDSVYFEEYVIKKSKVQKLVLHLPIKLRAHYHRIGMTTCEDRLVLASTQQGAHAEKAAAKVLGDFLSKQYPYLLQTQKEYYVSKEGDRCTCGVMINESRYIPNDGSISLLPIPGGTYAVLEGDCYGTSSDDEHFLRRWVEENGFEKDGQAFTLYDVSVGTERNQIIVRSYLKMAENNNTSSPKIDKLSRNGLDSYKMRGG
ncbi:helix-turn-helix domain-containing protein [Gorillibacterium timonense]|uniref:helix-turn-helix domain-containing protein n=1 Tax=Gorillibacterium timonense TaxID=1689269 RepID=UPI00071CDA45|nr:helix-turn-helix domain-containing protein [Gorillibacterium timonense]